jgi:hypothetical protein
MESGAAMLSINETLRKHILKKNYDQAYFWIVSHIHATKIVDDAHTNIRFKSINIMDAVRDADKVLRENKLCETFAESYNWFCEFLHPNNYGVLTTFSDVADVGDPRTVRFLDAPKVDRKVMDNCLLSATLSLGAFLHAWEQAKAIGPSIVSADWAATDQLEQLFSKAAS